MCSVQFASDRDAASEMHWLPCTVSHAGPAPVANYFMPHATGLPHTPKKHTTTTNPLPLRHPHAHAQSSKQTFISAM